MRIIYFLLTFAVLLIACKPSNDNPTVQKLETIVKKQAEIIEQLEQKPKGSIMHLVWLDLKPDLTKEQIENLTKALFTLEEIKEVKDYQVGNFIDLGDKRAMSELESMISMRFESKADYTTYQDHPVHLALKESLGEYLAGPPVTYDYTIQ